jgi:hypothetical protein
VAITWADVTKVAAELATLPVGTQSAILGYVATLLAPDAWGDKLDMGSTYLAAHLGTLAKRGGTGPAGPITSESEGPLSVSYAAPPLGADDAFYATTTYGHTYLWLVKSLAARVGMVL